MTHEERSGTPFLHAEQAQISGQGNKKGDWQENMRWGLEREMRDLHASGRTAGVCLYDFAYKRHDISTHLALSISRKEKKAATPGCAIRLAGSTLPLLQVLPQVSNSQMCRVMSERKPNAV